MNKGLAAIALASAVAVAACSNGNGAPPNASRSLLPAAPAERAASTTPIAHVLILIQENRSFDNFFARFPGADGARYGRMHTGARTPLVQRSLTSQPIDHMHGAFLRAYDGGKMDGFDLEGLGRTGKTAGKVPYQYVDPAQIAPYWSMAHQYVLADHMFQTQGSGSFTAHQELIAGGTAIDKTHSIIDLPTGSPWGCDAPTGTVTSLIDVDRHELVDQGPFPCLDYRTLGDLLDAKGISWKYYVSRSNVEWNAFDAIRAVRYGPEWETNLSLPNTSVFSDIANGTLPAVSWLIPELVNSDHPGSHSDTGPSWVAQVVNAVGQSSLWKSTAIVVVWDDWGGFYDHEPPPQLDYQGLGFRVPMLIVSPYARPGYVSHTQYEFGSILRFVEDNWRLGSLHQTDARATSIADAFAFASAPRPFAPIAAKYSRSYFEHQPPSDRPADDQ